MLGSCFAQKIYALREIRTSLTGTARDVISGWNNEFSSYTLKLTYTTFTVLGSCFAQKTHALRERRTSLTGTARDVISGWKTEFSSYTWKVTYTPFNSVGIMFCPKNTCGPGDTNFASRHYTRCHFGIKKWVFIIHLKIDVHTILQCWDHVLPKKQMRFERYEVRKPALPEMWFREEKISFQHTP